jgi:hypothetical protein
MRWHRAGVYIFIVKGERLLENAGLLIISRRGRRFSEKPNDLTDEIY